MEASIHCFDASDAALGKLICTNRADYDSKIITQGKAGTHALERFGAGCGSLPALSICRVPLALAQNSVCSPVVGSETRICLIFLEGLHTV